MGKQAVKVLEVYGCESRIEVDFDMWRDRVNGFKHELLARYNAATEAELADGAAWYPMQRLYNLAVSMVYDVDFDTAASVTAVLAQNVPWSMQVRFTVPLWTGLQADREPQDITYPKTSHEPMRKAIAVYKTRDSSHIRGRKLTHFGRNSRGDLSWVTADRWYVRSCMPVGTPDADCQRLLKNPISRPDRELVEQACIELAAELGLEPAALQAIVWIVQRRMDGQIDGDWMPFDASDMTDESIVQAWIDWIVAQ
jgi:hypothetical protein